MLKIAVIKSLRLGSFNFKTIFSKRQDDLLSDVSAISTSIWNDFQELGNS